VSAVDKWLTPQVLPGAVACRPLFIPDDETIIAAIAGALLPLTYENNWELFGAVTPAEIAVAMKTMFEQAFVEPCGVTMQVDIFNHSENPNVSGGGIVASTNTVVPYNSLAANNPNLVTLAANVFTVPAGRWLIDFWHVFHNDIGALQLCWIERISDGAIIQEGLHFSQPTNVNTVLRAVAQVLINADTDYRFVARANDTRATDAFGIPTNTGTHQEVYGQAVFTRIGDF